MSKEAFVLPIFDMEINFLDDREEAKAFYRERNGGEDPPAALDIACGCCLTGGNARMLCVFDPQMRFVVHEAVHMALAILNETGIKVNFRNDEPLTYLASYLSVEMMRFINENKKEAA